MLGQREANLAFVAVVAAACAYFAWVAEGFVTSGLLASSGLPSKFFPQLMLGLIALCSAVVGYLYWIRGGAGGDDGETVYGDRGEARRGLLMLAVAVFCYAVWRELGFIAMAVLLGPLSLAAMGIRNAWLYAVVLGLTALVYLAFTQLLGIRLA